jgi:hypothetical protein
MASGLIVLTVGPVAALQLPVASLNPKTGLAGSEVMVTVSQYSPSIVIEVHEETANGTLLGTGMTDASGTGTFPITIPATFTNGSHLLYICGLCTAQFPEWATRGFTVTGPAPPTTTTTTAATTTTTAAPTTTLTPTTVASATTVAATDAPQATAADAAETSSNRGLLVGLIIGLAALLAFIIGLLVASRGSTGPGRAPPPPPPPTA